MTRYTKSMREALEEVWANDIAIEEGKMKTIATLFDQGKSAEEIAQRELQKEVAFQELLKEQVKAGAKVEKVN